MINKKYFLVTSPHFCLPFPKLNFIFSENFENSATNPVYQTQKFEYSQYRTRPSMHASISSLEHTPRPYFPFARPRTRGRGKDEQENSRQTTDLPQTATKDPQPSHRQYPEPNKEEVSQRLSNHNLDPNIAYFPQPRRKAKTNIHDKNNARSTSTQHIAAAKQKSSPKHSSTMVACAAPLNSNDKTITVLEETIRLPR